MAHADNDERLLSFTDVWRFRRWGQFTGCTQTAIRHRYTPLITRLDGAAVSNVHASSRRRQKEECRGAHTDNKTCGQVTSAQGGSYKQVDVQVISRI